MPARAVIAGTDSWQVTNTHKVQSDRLMAGGRHAGIILRA